MDRCQECNVKTKEKCKRRRLSLSADLCGTLFAKNKFKSARELQNQAKVFLSDQMQINFGFDSSSVAAPPSTVPHYYPKL